MNPSNRRGFLQVSATAAAAIALDPLRVGQAANAASLPAAARSASDRVKARPVPLAKVRLTGGPLKQAQDAAAQYLLGLDPDRMMAYYRLRAGLPQKAEPYGGWDGGGRNLTGHIAGHHLSAVSLMHAATGDDRFRERAAYLVGELKQVQDAHGDGYLSALEGARAAFAALSRGEIRSSAFDLNGLWSPWYTLHKTFAGLRDAYRHTGNASALDVERKFAAWAEGVLAPLNDAQLARMLNTEFGGMNEVLSDLAADTADERWLALSQKFEHHAFTDALRRHQDNLAGKHGNCQIPKLIGSATRYEHFGDPADLVAAAFFWDRVTQHHSYATGGHGLAEYFGYPDRLSQRVDGRTCESCNVYNMLKLTRRLFSFRPDAYYADFHERALFNHALASFDPEAARMSYMVPVGRGVQQEYQDMQRSFTCCVGTGMENHALHGDGIYYESDDTAWVNLFAPSEAELADGTRLRMETGFPDGDTAALTVLAPRERTFTLAVRRPDWAGDGFALRVNGARIDVPPLASLRAGAAGGRDLGDDRAATAPASFVNITRAWRGGDRVELALPKSLRLEPTPDDRSVAAVLWGPLVLAGDLGPRRERNQDQNDPERPTVRREPVEPPMLVGAGRAVQTWVVPEGRPGDFRATGVARLLSTPSATARDVALQPFYRTHGRTYSVYFDVVTPADFDTRVAAVAAERDRQTRLERATVSMLRPGDADVEQSHDYRSEPADRAIVRSGSRTARGGPGWFSYTMPVEGDAPIALVLTFLNDLGLPVVAAFDVLVDGTRVGQYSPNRSATGFWDAWYDVPPAVAAGKRHVTVRFQAAAGGRVVPIYAVRMVRPAANLR